MSAIRKNYSEACESMVNQQINMQLYASYVYQSMVSYSIDLRDGSKFMGYPGWTIEREAKTIFRTKKN